MINVKSIDSGVEFCISKIISQLKYCRRRFSEAETGSTENSQVYQNTHHGGGCRLWPPLVNCQCRIGPQAQSFGSPFLLVGFYRACLGCDFQGSLRCPGLQPRGSWENQLQGGFAFSLPGFCSGALSDHCIQVCRGSEFSEFQLLHIGLETFLELISKPKGEISSFCSSSRQGRKA